MNKSHTISLRVEAYNKQFKTEEARIFLKKGADPNEATSYTSLLYERYLSEGAILETIDGMYLLSRKKIHPGGLLLRAMGFLQVLAYLEYYEDLRKNKLKMAMAVLREHNEREKAKELAKGKEEKKGFELEEKEGVTFIKNTHFVISKIL